MSYYGTPDDVVMLLGKISISAGRLEGAVIAIAEIYGVEAATEKFVSKLTKEIRTRANRWGVPEWARCSPAAVIEWSMTVDDVMNERNTRLHATSFNVMTGPGTQHENTFQHLRSGLRRPAVPTSFQSVLAGLELTVVATTSLQMDLMHRVNRYAYVRHTVSPSGGGDVIMNHGSDPNVPRVTDQEILDYWSTWDETSHAFWPPRESNSRE
jgi:hypothetical protein